MGLRFRATDGDPATTAFALPALINAHRLFVAATMPLRPAALKVRLRGCGPTGAEAGGCAVFGGLPAVSLALQAPQYAVELVAFGNQKDRIRSVVMDDERIASGLFVSLR